MESKFSAQKINYYIRLDATHVANLKGHHPLTAGISMSHLDFCSLFVWHGPSVYLFVTIRSWCGYYVHT